MDSLNWSGYDGLTTGALTLSTAAVDINSQGGNIQFASIAGGSQDLSLNAGVAAGTTTVTGQPRWETEPERLTVDNSADRIGRGNFCWKQWFGGRSGDQRTVCRRCNFRRRHRNEPSGMTLDGLNWSGYDGLTTGALTLSTAAVDINSQETSSLQALQEEVRTLA